MDKACPGPDFGVCGYTVWRRGVVTVDRLSIPGSRPNATYCRGMVTELSRKSRQRMGFVLSTTNVDFGSMMTLTYGQQYPVDGREVKKSLHAMLKKIKYRYACEYFWWLEFQRRGAPHVHVLLTRRNVFNADRRWFADTWVDVIGVTERRLYSLLKNKQVYDQRQQMLNVHRHPKSWEEIRVPGGGVKYGVQYALKPKQKGVPLRYGNVGRFWGCSRRVGSDIRAIHSEKATDEQMRELLVSQGHSTADWPKLPKYIFGLTGLDVLQGGKVDKPEDG